MNCKRCNAPLESDVIFCQSCGSPVETDNNMTQNVPILNNTDDNNLEVDKSMQYMSGNPKSNKNVIIVLIFIIIALLGAVGYLAFADLNNDSGVVVDNNKPKEEDKTMVTPTAKKYVINEYSFSAPEDWVFEYYDEILYFANEEIDMIGKISIDSRDYSFVKDNVEQIIINFGREEFEITNNYEKQINSHYIYVFEGVYQLEKYVMYIGQINSSTVAIIEVKYDSDAVFREKAQEVLDMVSTLNKEISPFDGPSKNFLTPNLRGGK